MLTGWRLCSPHALHRAASPLYARGCARASPKDGDLPQRKRRDMEEERGLNRRGRRGQKEREDENEHGGTEEREVYEGGGRRGRWRRKDGRGCGWKVDQC